MKMIQEEEVKRPQDFGTHDVTERRRRRTRKKERKKYFLKNHSTVNVRTHISFLLHFWLLLLLLWVLLWISFLFFNLISFVCVCVCVCWASCLRRSVRICSDSWRCRVSCRLIDIISNGDEENRSDGPGILAQYPLVDITWWPLVVKPIAFDGLVLLAGDGWGHHCLILHLQFNL